MTKPCARSNLYRVATNAVRDHAELDDCQECQALIGEVISNAARTLARKGGSVCGPSKGRRQPGSLQALARGRAKARQLQQAAALSKKSTDSTPVEDS